MSVLDERCSGDQPPSPVELDGREISPHDPEPVASKLPGCRYSGSAAKVGYLGPDWQQAGQLGYPSCITANVFRRGDVRATVVASVRQ